MSYRSLLVLCAVVAVVATPTAAVALDAASAPARDVRIVSVVPLPGGKALAPNKVNVVRVTADLAFRATVRNATAGQLRNVRVALAINQPTRPVVKTVTIPRVGPHRRATVTFGHFGAVAFAMKLKANITVGTSAHTVAQSYPIIFALG